MTTPVPLAQCLLNKSIDVAKLAELARLDQRIVEAIVAGRYTTSPNQRQRIADAFGRPVAEIQWSGAVGVDHMYGHGPQFGRSP